MPSDKKLLTLSEDLIQQFEAIFGAHPGFRPAHARGAGESERQLALSRAVVLRVSVASVRQRR